MKSTTILAIVLGCWLLATVGIVVYLINIRPPLYYTNLPFKVDSPVRAGEAVRLYAERCNSTNQPLSYPSTRSLVRLDTDPRQYTALVYAASTTPPGCASVVSVINIIPDDTVPGRYMISATALVPSNLQPFNLGITFNVPWFTEPFDVVTPS